MVQLDSESETICFDLLQASDLTVTELTLIITVKL